MKWCSFHLSNQSKLFFSFDYAVHEQRLAANILISFMVQENWDNLKEIEYLRADGTVDPLPLGVPRSWAKFDEMPKAGQFSGMYVCAPEDRKYKYRCQLLRSYTAWTAPEKASEVKWWVVMSETPEDVQRFNDFVVTHFESTKSAFEFIDGDDGNGLITRKEFEEGILRMECHKFRRPDDTYDKDRITKVFRYLDPSGEGQVSPGEFSILDMLGAEVKLSIGEFVQYLTRNFGHNLQDAWKEFDEDDNGEIDYNEWMRQLDVLGYYGEGKSIFHYLDKDDEGTISPDEWELLEDFNEKVVVKRKMSVWEQGKSTRMIKRLANRHNTDNGSTDPGASLGDDDSDKDDDNSSDGSDSSEEWNGG